MGGIRLGGVEYTREQVKGFYEWQMLACLKHFPDETDSEDRAKAFAFSRPNANGFITFQTKYRGKRFYWIEKGEAVELEPIACYLRTLPKNEKS
jgi:hypothetical protein